MQACEETLQGLLQQKNDLKMNILNSKSEMEKVKAKEELKEVEKKLTNNFSSKSAEIIREHIREVKGPEGKFSNIGFWKLKKKFCPKAREPPMAKMNEQGILITSPNLLKTLYLQTYSHRLRQREMKTEYLDVFFLKSELWKYRMEELVCQKSKPWNLKDLIKVLKSLKNNKTMDPNGMINEIFKPGCIGTDLEEALLILFNGIKTKMSLPEFLTLGNITSIWKQKGSKKDMNSERGIFILTVLKKCLDKLIFFDNVNEIDENMSDSNIGGRKDRNIKNHLFMIYGIINSVVKGKEDCVDIQIYDIEKAFDGLWLEDCLNDIYDVVPQPNKNDKLALLYKSNQKNMVSVNTAVGLTERIDIPNIVQQGGTWGPALCSNTIDTLGKKCQDRNLHNYYYKNISRVLIFAMCDDLNSIAKYGIESVALNTYITTQIEFKKLRFHIPLKMVSLNAIRSTWGEITPCALS